MRNFSVVDIGEMGDIYPKSIESFLNLENSLKKYKSYDLLYFLPKEPSSHPINHIYENSEIKNKMYLFQNILEENDIKLYFIYGTVENVKFNFNINNLKVLTWPTYLLHNSCYDMELVYNKKITDINKETIFEKTFICLNNQPRAHRCAIIDNISKLNLFKDGVVSWNILTEGYCDYQFKHWKEKIINVDKINDKIDKDYRSYTNLFLDNKCFLNVVSESYCDDNVPFITEKTYKNLLVGQPFITFGTIGMNKELEKLGFKLYDEIFDYSFDIIEGFEERVDSFTKNINLIKNENLNNLYVKIKDKIKYNKNKCLEILNNDPHIPNEFVNLYKCNSEKFNEHNMVPYFLKNIMTNK